MLRQQREISGRLNMVLDAMLLCFAWYLAYWLRTIWYVPVMGAASQLYPFEEYDWLFVVIVPVGLISLRSAGFYSRPLVPSRRLTCWQLGKGCLWTAAALIFAMWFFRQGATIARSVVPFFAVISFVLITIKEELFRSWRTSLMGQGLMQRRLILLGSPEATAQLRESLSREGYGELMVVAELEINGLSMVQLVNAMHDHSVNGVIVSGKHAYFGQIEEVIEVCEREGVEVLLMADLFKTTISRTRVDEFFGRPMLVFGSGPEKSWPTTIKLVIDSVGASVLLLFLGLPMLAVALAIRLTSPGPVLFRQQRSGLNGKPFTMLKFRSMVSDAEQLKQELEALNEMKGPVFKVTNDPRITPIGRWLRRYSVDELPQLINVWRGEMSLVGPRPLPVDEVRRFDDASHRRRLSVKPGLTCLWQISGRNQVTDFAEWVRLDLEYIDNWSLWLDLKILLRTIPVVLTGAGAK
ncbi:MAG: sugar transferase [Limisphaerales bacterium]